jgi:hypothetical protein
LRGEPGVQDINMLHAWTGRESLDATFTRRLGKPAQQASIAEIAAVRPLAQADLVARAGQPVLLKTHNAVANVDGHPTINLGVTLAAVYLVRNPLDVAVSYAHHSGHTVDHVIEFMAGRQMTGVSAMSMTIWAPGVSMSRAGSASSIGRC